MFDFSVMDNLEKAFWFIAFPSSIIFAIQTVMTFMGGDTEGLDADFDGNLDGVDAPFQLFSLRNLINFLLGFSWTGISFYDSIENKTVLILVAVGVGSLFLFLFYLIMKQIQKLAENNTFQIKNILGGKGLVYYKIPKSRESFGKIHISYNNTMKEVRAITDNDFDIPTGMFVQVIEIIENDLVLVKLA